MKRLWTEGLQPVAGLARATARPPLSFGSMSSRRGCQTAKQAFRDSTTQPNIQTATEPNSVIALQPNSQPNTCTLNYAAITHAAQKQQPTLKAAMEGRMLVLVYIAERKTLAEACSHLSSLRRAVDPRFNSPSTQMREPGMEALAYSEGEDRFHFVSMHSK